jgi:cytochrome P450
MIVAQVGHGSSVKIDAAVQDPACDQHKNKEEAVEAMSSVSGHTPPGPADAYDPSDDLLGWMQLNFEKYGDIYRASIYGSSVYVVNTPQMAEHVLLKNWRNYLRKGQAVKRIAFSLGPGLISTNGERWASQRRMIQPAFTHAAVSELFEAICVPNQSLFARWQQAAAAGQTVDVTHDLSLTVLEVTLRAIFGRDYESVAAEFQIIADETRNLEFAQVCSELGSLIVTIVQARRKRQSDDADILGRMMSARDRQGSPMPDAQLARESLTLVIAGHETTASVLNWVWYLLAKHPDVQSRVAAEVRNSKANAAISMRALQQLSYTCSVLEEALRSYPPLWLMTRKTIKPDLLGGYEVPSGTEIYISPYLLHRHPRLWQDPHRFDPERFEAGGSENQQRLSMCPFGAGPRNCIGEYFARIEMQVHLATIIDTLSLYNTVDEPPRFVAGVNLLSRDHFIMRPQLRDASAVN